MMQIDVEEYVRIKKQFSGVVGLRYGQYIYQQLKLEKCVQYKEICDKLYELDGVSAISFFHRNFQLI